MVLNIEKALSGSSWGFSTETYNKAIVRPILNKAAPFGSQKGPPPICLDKLEVTHNKTLRIETGCHQKAAVSHLRPETGVLPLRVHLELWSLQLYASALQLTHSSHFIITSPLILVQWRQYSRARTVDPSEACDSEVTIPMPPLSSLGASWERVLIP